MPPETARPASSRHAAADPFTLRPARVHEAEGRGKRAFALFQAARHPGPVIWILPGHLPELPMLRGLPDGVGQRLHLLRPGSEVDLLWSAEEALRSPAPGLVIAEPEKELSLTAGRRLQLAAEAGRTTGLMLIREGQGSNAAETRWRCNPQAAQGQDSTPQAWRLIKNKSGTCQEWCVDWNGATAAFHMVSEACERYKPAQAAP